MTTDCNDDTKLWDVVPMSSYRLMLNLLATYVPIPQWPRPGLMDPGFTAELSDSVLKYLCAQRENYELNYPISPTPHFYDPVICGPDYRLSYIPDDLLKLIQCLL